jgi:putative peptidoglycan lipid II flippase
MRRLARDVLMMALATGVSRLLGLLRDVAIADRFGASGAYDAFLIAFFAPHFLRQLLAEGALSTAFVPLYTGLRVANDDADRFASSLLSWLVLLFAGVVGLGVWLAPSYVPFLASGFPAEKLTLAIRLTRIVFPFIALVGFAAVFMGILTSHRRFFAASLAPVWFNVGMILGIVILAPRLFAHEPVLGLAVGALIGGGGQLLAQGPSLRRVGFRFRPMLWPIHPEIRRLIRLMGPAVLTLAVTQINLLVDNKLASHLGDGGISSLQYGMRLFQLPLGVFAVSVATALLPRFSEAWARRDNARFSSYLSEGIVLSALVLLPAMVGLFAIGADVVRLLFEHGSFTPQDTIRTVRVLSFYLIGLFPYGLVYLFSRAFYALRQTRIPLLAAGAAVAVNVALDLLLVSTMGEAGLALATAVSGVANAVMLGVFLIPRLRRAASMTLRLGLIALGCGFLYGLVWGIRRFAAGDSIVAAVFEPLAVGVVFYGIYVRFTPLWALVTGWREDGPASSER